MVVCSTCLGWYHPQCVFTCSTPLSFTRKQWSKVHVACEGVKVNMNCKPSLVYHHKVVETKHCGTEGDDNPTLPVLEVAASSCACKCLGSMQTEKHKTNCEQICKNCYETCMVPNASTDEHQLVLWDDKRCICVDHMKRGIHQADSLHPNANKDVYYEDDKSVKHDMRTIVNELHLKMQGVHGNMNEPRLVEKITTDGHNAKEKFVKNMVCSELHTVRKQFTEGSAHDRANHVQPRRSTVSENWISRETLAQLQKISTKNEKSLNLNENLDICSVVKLSLEEWKAMTENRKDHAFTGDSYRDILLKKLCEIYSGCVPCVRRHYLRHPKKTCQLMLLINVILKEMYICTAA